MRRTDKSALALSLLGTTLGLWLVLGTGAIAQTPQLDNLRQTAEQQYRQGNVTEAIIHYADLIRESLTLGTGLPLAADFNRLGELYESQATYESYYRALSARQEAVKIYQEAGELRQAAATLDQMADNASEMSEFILLVDYQQQALELYEQLGEMAQAAEIALELGQFHSLTGEMEVGLPHLEQAIALFDRLNSPKLPEALIFAANISLQNNLTEQGFGWYDDLFDYYRQQGDWAAYAQHNLRAGEWQNRKGDPRASLRYYEAAVEGYLEAGNPDQALEAYHYAALYHMSAENLPQALATYEEAVALAERTEQPQATAWLFVEVGKLHRRLQQGESTIGYYRRALQLYRTPPAAGWAAYDLNQAQVNNIISTILVELQEVYQDVLLDPEQTLAIAQERVQLWEQLGDREELKFAITDLARTYDELGQRNQAIATYEQLVEMRNRDLDNLNDYTFVTRELAQLYYAVGNEAAAIAHVEAAVQLYRDAQETDGLIRALATLGDTYHRLGNVAQRDASYQEATTLAEQTNNYFLQHAMRSRLADLKYDATDFEGAVAILKQNVAIARQIQSDELEILALERLSNFFSPWMNLAVEDVAQSFDYRAEARRILRNNENYRGLAENFEWSGNLAWFEDQPEQALRYYQQALDAYDQTTFPDRDKAEVWADMGYIAVQQGQTQTGLRYLELAQNHDFRRTWDVLKSQGDAYRQLNQLDRALDLYEQSLLVSNSQVLTDSVGSTFWRHYLDTWTAIAQIHRTQGDYAAAFAQIQKVIREVEAYSRQIQDPRARQTFFASVQTYYDTYIDILMQLHQQQPGAGYQEQALQADERRRTQGLLGMLTEANVDLRRDVEPALLEREAVILKEIEALETERIVALSQAAAANNIQSLNAERDRLLAKYQTVQEQIRAANPQYAQIQYSQSLTVREIQQLLDADTVLLQYSLGEQQSYLWVVSQQGIESHVLPPRAELEELTRTFNRRLRSATPPERIQTAALNLSQPLIEPIHTPISGKRLLIVSDGALQYIPFAALTQPTSDDYDPLINHHEIITLPSISTLATLRETANRGNRASQTLSLMADPVFTPNDARVTNNKPTETLIATRQASRAAQDVGINWSRLPGTRTEAQEILALVPDDEESAHFGFAAKRETVFEPHFGDARFVHFATHGFVNTQKPELSGIVMSLLDEDGQPQNGFLRLQDVYKLDLAAEMVVLSACETGTGQLIRGEGLIGLTRGFMYAGAERVVASLWQVDDAATAALMGEFYRQLLTENAPPAEALRLAQQAIASQPQWSAPYYWAAFTLQGDW